MKVDPNVAQSLGFTTDNVGVGAVKSFQEVMESPFYDLLSCPELGYTFAVSSSELVFAARGEKKFKLFGHCFFGVFGILESGEIWYFSAGGEIFCSSSIRNFARMLSIVYYSIFTLRRREGLNDDEVTEKCEAWAEELIREFDKMELSRNIAESFWHETVMALEEGMISSRPAFAYFVNTGQIRTRGLNSS